MNAQLQPTANEAPQILLDVPAEEYHRRELGVATSSVLRMLRDKTPAHYRAWVDQHDADETPALVFGRAYHCRVLEPDVFADTYAVMPDFGDLRSSKNREARDAWKAERPGVTTLSQEWAEKIEEMHAALLRHPVAAGIMREGVSEATFRWVDDATGIRCKARADWWVESRGFLMDLKTTEDASPAAFARSVERYGYHIQHAHYCDAARMCGTPVRNYLIVAQEKEAPYLPAVYHIDAAAEVRGFELRDRGLQTMRECIESNTWPGYSGITELSLPAWAMKD